MNRVRFSSLPALKGFNSDFRAPRLDHVAFVASQKIFGVDVTRRCLSTHYRPGPSLDLLRAGVLKYDRERTPPRPLTPEYLAALDSIREEFRPQESLIPISTGAAFEHPDLPHSTSPGLDWIHKGYKTKRDCIQSYEAFSYVSRTWDMIGKGYKITLPDSCAYNRLQISERTKAPKVRPVWGYPFEVIIEEGRFFYPLLSSIKSKREDHCYAIGLEMANGGMSYINDAHQRLFLKKHDFWMNLDFSNYDASVPSWLIRDVFNIISEWYDFSRIQSSDGRIWSVNPVQQRRRYAKFVNYFINTTIRLPNGERYRKVSGVPSGSMFTNLIDTLCNAVICRFIAYHTTGSFPLFDLYMGDDGLLLIRGHANLKDWKRLAKRFFGMEFSADKAWVTKNPDNIHFLGFFNRCGLPKRNNDFLVRSFCYPERTVRNEIETACRAAGQLYSCLDPRLAHRWLMVLEDCLSYSSLTYSDVEKFMMDNPHRFKYLRQLGLDLASLPSLSRMYNGAKLCFAVHPPLSPTRAFRRRPYSPEGRRYFQWIPF
jgi:hypothetical protein